MNNPLDLATGDAAQMALEGPQVRANCHTPGRVRHEPKRFSRALVARSWMVGMCRYANCFIDNDAGLSGHLQVDVPSLREPDAPDKRSRFGCRPQPDCLDLAGGRYQSGGHSWYACGSVRDVQLGSPKPRVDDDFITDARSTWGKRNRKPLRR